VPRMHRGDSRVYIVDMVVVYAVLVATTAPSWCLLFDQDGWMDYSASVSIPVKFWSRRHGIAFAVCHARAES